MEFWGKCVSTREILLLSSTIHEWRNKLSWGISA